MAGKFEYLPFANIDLSDPFFDSLKIDYPEFETTWFPKCVREGRQALVFSDAQGLGAFVATKEENEAIQLQEGTLPARNRLKISTLKLADRFHGQRLGEGAIGLVLWQWQKLKLEEIYLTVFPSHGDLISQLEKFGFICVGHNSRGELAYFRSRKNIDFSDPYRSFPFLSPDYQKGGYLIVEDTYHDTLFPYSELKNTQQEMMEVDAANGITKIYIGQQWTTHYQKGEPVFIYRKYTGDAGRPRYKSCLTSFCVVSDVINVKRKGKPSYSFNEFCKLVGNKSVFDVNTLRAKYDTYSDITVIILLYCGYFGGGNNVNMDWLDNNHLWKINGSYPTHTQLSPVACEKIWQKGEVDIDNLFGR